MRVGLGLVVAAAASDTLFAAIAGARLLTVLVGVALTGCAAVGLFQPRPAARLLCRRGRVLLAVGAFAAVGALDPGVIAHYGEIQSAIVWVAVITSSGLVVALCVAASATGYVADLALQGHSLAWMSRGAGRDVVAQQVIDLAANAGAMLLLLAVLRRFLVWAPHGVADVRCGGRSLTPQLALAANEEGHPLVARWRSAPPRPRLRGSPRSPRRRLRWRDARSRSPACRAIFKSGP